MNTSAQAYETVKPKVPSIRQRVLDAVQTWSGSGLTREQLIEITGIHQNSISGRITELKDDGLIAVKGTRTNSRGNPEDVYVPGDGVPLTKEKPVAEPTVPRSALIYALRELLNKDTSASIRKAFYWENTPQGHAFWKGVADEVEGGRA